MILRSVYRFIIRLHPDRFLEQFENQLMSTFDDHVRSTWSAASFTADACVSLIRQWLLRPENFGPMRMAALGPAALEELGRRSRLLQRRAWRLNFGWAVAL